MRKKNNSALYVVFMVLVAILASVIFVKLVNANNGNGNSSMNVTTINSTTNSTINSTTNNGVCDRECEIAKRLKKDNGRRNTTEEKENKTLIFGNLTRETSSLEKIYKFQVISSDLKESDTVPQVQIDERGQVVINLKLNATFTGYTTLWKTYYLSPEDDLGNYLNYSALIRVNSRPYQIYYESAIFNLLNSNFSAGLYKIYRTYDGIPLFLGDVNITGNLPDAVSQGTIKKEDSWSDNVLNSVKEIWDYLFGKKEVILVLAVNSVNWVHSGENWEIYANYSDQNSNPILEANCRLNTDKWGLLQMHYVPEKKLYMAEHVADSIGQLKWTVVCEEKR